MPAHRKIYLTVESNFGRGVSAARFRRAVEEVLEGAVAPGGKLFEPLPPNDRIKQSVIWGPTELDEADRPNEHKDFKAIVGPALAGAEHLVGWDTYEPLVISHELEVLEDHVISACKGLARFTPERFFVEALVEDPDFRVPPVLFRNHHAPIGRPQTASRRTQCKRKHRQRWMYWWGRGVSQVDIGDYNQYRYPRWNPNIKDANVERFDYIRIASHPKGAQLKVMSKGRIPGFELNHPALWARISATPPKVA